jgi:NAD-dependent dihydropyrimidine dehydrogenase PreA subunit
MRRAGRPPAHDPARNLAISRRSTLAPRLTCHPKAEENTGERTLYIHPEECIDCGACEPVCPVKAIFPEDEVPEQWTPYTEMNGDYYRLSRDDFTARWGVAP